MSNSKMLIDATHPEETRVVVVRGGRVEEFDYESAARKLLRGNIYLAKVTRVEPSLQAAFVDYGGNRHGFLAFNEIHPDYYQIPVADRQALIDEEAQAEAEEEAEADAHAEAHGDSVSDDSAEADEAGAGGDHASGDREPATDMAARHGHGNGNGEDARSEPTSHAISNDSDDGEQGGVHEVDAGNGNGEAEVVEEVSTEQDALEEVPSRPRRRMRSYKIQEVIKRRQVVLVQVVKEERGNKGAALTTYLSLAGRYTVLMPNTARGGGISRKITNPGDRKRLKAIAHELEVPEGMGLIIRTAGAARTKQEIKRDFEYLLRLWESVRDLTLQSTAPSLVYEEGNLIKRSIRDHFTKDVDEVVVAGEAAHAEAHDFMRMLMPSHAKNVISYKDMEPLFARFRVEQQLSAMFSPFVTLRSGGYLVINQTEALVAVDINSGKSTREFSIEETALNTNLEAAEEIARQLKLRDLAGLIVIDFIDMEEKRNNRSVERRLKDSLRFDRARIQIGRISHFGLLEMSRQRLRTGVLEGSTTQCPHCQGTGIVRSTESVALAVLRGVEDALMANPRGGVIASTTSTVVLYILNTQRAYINEMEVRYGISIVVQASDKLHGANFNIERTAIMTGQPQRRPERQAVNMDWGFEGEGEAAGSVEEVESEVEAEEVGAPGDDDSSDHIEVISDDPDGEDDNGRRGRGRRRRRRGRGGDRPEGDHTPEAGRGQRGEPREARGDRGGRRDRGDRGDRGDQGGRGGHRGRPAPQQPSRLHGESSDTDAPEAQHGDDGSDVASVTFTSYAMLAADVAAGGDGIGEVRSPERFDDANGDDGDRGGRRGRRRGRRGGRRGRDRDAPRFDGDVRANDRSNGNGHDSRPVRHDAAEIAGQGPQPDLPDDLPVDFTVAEQRAPRRRERWRDRRRGGDYRNDERWSESSNGVSAAVMAAAAAAGGEAAIQVHTADAGVAAAEIAAPAIPSVLAEPVHVPAAPVVEPAVALEPAPPPVAVEAAPAPRPRRVSGTSSAEPRIEHVVMRPDQREDTSPEGALPPPQAPTRKGWWQRRFGDA